MNIDAADAKFEYLIVPKGTNFTGSGLGLIVTKAQKNEHLVESQEFY